MAEQTDLLDGDGIEPDPAPDHTEGAVPTGPGWRELEIGGRPYRWRVRWDDVDRTRWSPEDGHPPGPGFELEFWDEQTGRWTAVRWPR